MSKCFYGDEGLVSEEIGCIWRRRGATWSYLFSSGAFYLKAAG